MGARLSAALDAASAKHAQAVAEGRGLAALQALEAQLAPAAAAGAEAPAAEGAEGAPAGVLKLDAWSLSSLRLTHHGPAASEVLVLCLPLVECAGAGLQAANQRCACR